MGNDPESHLPFERGPGRGRYERQRSGAERFAAQRKRLLSATALAHFEGNGSVTRVTTLAGVGRATFYECFDDFAHALTTVRREAHRRVRKRLEQCSSEAKVSELCRQWLEEVVDEPLAALASLGAPREVEPELVGPLQQALSARFPLAPGDARWLYVVASALASARAVAITALVASRGSFVVDGLVPATPNVPVGMAVDLLVPTIECVLGA